MITIGLCEDEREQLDFFEKLLRDFLTGEGIKARILCFESADSLWYSFDGEHPFDLLILDIQMKGLTGIELAKKIRSENTHAEIIFLTGVMDYVLEGYEVGAFRYLLKPVEKSGFYAVMKQVCEKLCRRDRDIFLLEANGESYRIAYSDILYLEADGHYVVLHKREGELRWKENFSRCLERLSSHGFVLGRRGILVNLQAIDRIGKNGCILDTGETLPVSKGCYGPMNQAFIQYWKQIME